MNVDINIDLRIIRNKINKKQKIVLAVVALGLITVKVIDTVIKNKGE